MNSALSADLFLDRFICQAAKFCSGEGDSRVQSNFFWGGGGEVQSPGSSQAVRICQILDEVLVVCFHIYIRMKDASVIAFAGKQTISGNYLKKTN